MNDDYLTIRSCPTLEGATLVLAFTGWMDGGDVSTGTVRRLVDLLGAEPIAQIDPEPFYIYNFPGYLQGANPMSIEAVTRRLAKILRLSLDLDSLRAASTQWELEVSSAVEKDEDLAKTVRELEDAYDNDLLSRKTDDA